MIRSDLLDLKGINSLILKLWVVVKFKGVAMGCRNGVMQVCLRSLKIFGVLWGGRSKEFRDLVSWPRSLK